MSVPRPAWLFASILLLSPGLAAQQAPSDPQAIALLQQCFVAMGGPASPGISTVMLSGQVTQQRARDQIQGTVTFKLAGLQMSRLDTQLGTDTISHIVNGSRGSETRGGTTRRLPYHAVLNHHLKLVPLFSEVAQWASPNYLISYKGLEIVEGRNVHHIHTEQRFPGRPPDKAAILGSLSAVELYVDANSFLLFKRAQQIPTFMNLQNTLLLEQYYSDYRSVGGVFVPYGISIRLRGQRSSDIVVSSVVFNAGVSPSDFEVR